MNLYDIESFLVENWGNLKELPPEILKRLKYVVGAGVGANSSINRIPFKKPESIWNLVYKNEGNVGFFIKAYGQPVLYCLGYGYRNKDITLDREVLSEVAPETKDHYYSGSRDKNHSQFHNMSNAASKRLLRSIMDSLIKNNVTVQLYAITSDSERSTAIRKRQDQKIYDLDWHYYGKDKTVPATQPYYIQNTRYYDKSDFVRHTREALFKRLKQFKADKLANQSSFKTPEDFFSQLQKSGYMKQIAIDGFIYELKPEALNFHALAKIKPTDSWDKPEGRTTIYYKINTSLSPKYQELDAKIEPIRAQRRKLHAEDKDSEQYKEANKSYDDFIAEINKTTPPVSFEIKMELKGASIVPTGIILSNNRVTFY